MKTLITYFSWSNNTKKIVEDINKDLNYDVERIERKFPYSKDYAKCAYEEAKDEWENKTFPEIKDLNLTISSYDKILLFFPIWWYTIPRPIATFVKYNLEGYKGEINIFANSYTNDPNYIENSFNDLKEINPNLNIKNGLLNKSIEEHIKFIKEEK